MAKQTKLTRAARGEDCTLQIHPYCNDNPETVVYCHLPSPDKSIALKSPDYWGVYGCSACHAVIDGHTKTELTKFEIMQCMWRARYRTMKRQIEQGVIRCA